MASISYQNKVFHVLGLLSFLLVIEKSNAVQFPVGGDLKGWTVPNNTSSKNHYNDWANITRFQIGDSLLFSYDSSKDSVLQVSKEDYDNCTTTNPIAAFHDAKTVITFKHSGPYYFISGNKDNCLQNEKVVVVVLADRSSKHSTANTNETTTASPPPPGSPDTVQAPTPSSDETPPTGIVDTNPAQAPADVPPNSASSMFVSFVVSTGTIFASSLILSF